MSVQRAILRVRRLVAAAQEKSRAERERIVLTIGKILIECEDEAYAEISKDPALTEGLRGLNIDYGYEHENQDRGGRDAGR